MCTSVFNNDASCSNECGFFCQFCAVDGEIESVKWNPRNPFLFVASTENGTVVCRDVRKPSQAPIWTLGYGSRNLSLLLVLLLLCLMQLSSFGVAPVVIIVCGCELCRLV